MKPYLQNLFRVFRKPALLLNDFWLNEVYYGFTSLFNPKQKWLTRVIPNTWCDKSELIPQILFECLIHFVEKEEGLKQLDIDWDKEIKNGYLSKEYVDSVIGVYTDLKKAYEYVKNERPFLQKQHEESYPPYPLPNHMKGLKYEELYGEQDRLEKLIEEKDQWAMHTIVTHVDYMWT